MANKEGALRVWNIVNPPNDPEYYSVNNPEEAIVMINKLADAQLKNEFIECNAFGLEVFENGEWSEWYSEDGEDIIEYEETITA